MKTRVLLESLESTIGNLAEKIDLARSYFLTKLDSIS
jgi:hypothetical protein